MLHIKEDKTKINQWPKLETSGKNVFFQLHSSFHGITLPFVSAGDLI